MLARCYGQTLSAQLNNGTCKIFIDIKVEEQL